MAGNITLDARAHRALDAELKAKGFKAGFEFDQPKIDLFWHRDSVNTEGVVQRNAGSIVKNLPGDPTYISKKASVGLFPWPPSQGCACSWCQERKLNGGFHEDVVEELANGTGEVPAAQTEDVKVLMQTIADLTAKIDALTKDQEVTKPEETKEVLLDSVYMCEEEGCEWIAGEHLKNKYASLNAHKRYHHS